MLVSDEKRKRTCATLNGGCKEFTRNAFFWGGRAVQSIQSLWVALWLSLLCASWHTFSLARERRTSPKNRLTHGKESQCAKRMNAGLPEGEFGWETSINNYIMLNGYDYWRGNKVGLFRMVTFFSLMFILVLFNK